MSVIWEKGVVSVIFACVQNFESLRTEKLPLPTGHLLGAKTKANNKINPHITPSPGIKPGAHWWEASALTTRPSLLPLLH